jgi:HD-GYP domain-containing protein (c-di-GMP phosphodiesterase class II)
MIKKKKEEEIPMKKVRVNELKPGMKLATSVIDHLGRELLKPGTVLKENLILRLRIYGIKEVLIEGESSERVEENLASIFKETKNKAVECVKSVMRNMEAGNKQDAKEIRETVEDLVDKTMLAQNLMNNLIFLKSYDHCLYTHSVNVCALSLIIGIYLEYDKSQLEELGCGALLHNLGMVKIPKEIWDHPGTLTAEQYEEIKKHPIYGRSLLKTIKGIPNVASEIAYEHHERMNGSGYPRGVPGYKINPFARIVSVADVYAALVSDRRYRRKKIPPEAIKLVLGESENLFDKKVIRAFLSHMSIYPVGSVVLLNNGEIGLVIGTHRNLPFRPKLTIVFDKNGNKLTYTKIIDLAEEGNSSYFIVRSLEEENLNLDISAELEKVL